MVEVLVAIAVISSVLGTAYAITNRSVQTNQNSAERSVATKVAQTQLELLKSFTLAGNPLPANKFCMYVNTPTNQLVAETIPVTPPHPDNCYRDSNANLTTAGDNRYQVAISRAVTGTENLLTISVDWDGPTGQRDTVSMVYKVYQ